MASPLTTGFPGARSLVGRAIFGPLQHLKLTSVQRADTGITHPERTWLSFP
jgi:hypothetical protein